MTVLDIISPHICDGVRGCDCEGKMVISLQTHRYVIITESDVGCIFSCHSIFAHRLCSSVNITISHWFELKHSNLHKHILLLLHVSLHSPWASLLKSTCIYCWSVFLSLLIFTYVLCISTSMVLNSSSDCLRDTNPFDCQLTITTRL